VDGDFLHALENGKILEHLRRTNKLSARKWCILDYDFETLILQFYALGLIKKSDRKKPLTDHAIYWTLEKKGDKLLIKLRAVYIRLAA